MKFSLLLRKEVQNLGCLLGYVCLWGLYKCTQKEMKIVKDYMGIVKREHIEISPWIIIFVNIEPNSIRMQPKVYLQGLQDDENVFVWFRILVKIKHYVFVLISTSLQFVLRVYKMGSLQLHWLTFWKLTELTFFWGVIIVHSVKLMFIAGTRVYARGLDNVFGLGWRRHTCESCVPPKPAHDQGRLRWNRSFNCSP